MEKVIGNKKKRNIIIIVSCVIVFAMAGLAFFSQPNEYKDEIRAVKSFMRYLDEPDGLIINRMERYVRSEQEIYYYYEWHCPVENVDEIVRVLLIYRPYMQEAEMRHFNDLEAGLFKNVMANWEQIKDFPDRVFTEEEMIYIKEEAASRVIK